MSKVTVPYVMDNDYFRWLCEEVSADDEQRPYIYLMRELFETEFSDETAVLIPHDHNRIEDGLELRKRYSEEARSRNENNLGGNCSLLEMIIALAKRIEDSFGKYDYISWFWEMIGNLELMDFDDYNPVWISVYEYPDKVWDTIDTLLDRTYTKNGDGSLFPMNHAKRDMRKTEIWYQMSNYLVERYM